MSPSELVAWARREFPNSILTDDELAAWAEAILKVVKDGRRTDAKKCAQGLP